MHRTIFFVCIARFDRITTACAANRCELMIVVEQLIIGILDSTKGQRAEIILGMEKS